MKFLQGLFVQMCQDVVALHLATQKPRLAIAGESAERPSWNHESICRIMQIVSLRPHEPSEYNLLFLGAGCLAPLKLHSG